jgi:FKBP-type peptidyl-prolyl cis-trans isomerase FkpA
MKQFFYLLAVTTIVLASCTSGSFTKSEKGMEYRIISSGSGKTLENGNFFEIQFQQTYKGAGKDTMMFDSRKFANQITIMDSVQIPAAYYKIFSKVKKGDSIVVKQLVDSLMKDGGNLPPYMKKGGHLVAYYKIVNVYFSKEAADSANKVQMALAQVKDSVNKAEQIKKDDKVLSDYLALKNIKATKSPKGVYVETLQEGIGEKIGDSVGVKIKYTGKNLAGKAFDSNVDSQFHHTELLPVDMWAPRVIPGWVDGLRMLSKGSKARFYIPSSLGYGEGGQAPAIAPNENLIFDVEVVEITDKKQAMADQQAMQQKMMQQQMQMQAMQEKMKGQQQAPANK